MQRTLKALIIGGYGEFGGRLAQLLLRDGHNIIVAGRSGDRAEQFCQAYGGSPLKLDIATDLHMIDTLGVDVVVDAAGPYQTYREHETPYRVATRALKCGAHYLDLSDDGAFSRDIVCLDALAKEHGRVALSGASSTPALSGAAVTALSSAQSSIELIETSILPGCRAPQGRSVMLAILDQVGNPIPFWRDGAWENQNGWSAPSLKRMGNSIRRNANLINAADVVLFPQHFNAKSVLFRAGLAMPIMHRSLQMLGSLRSLALLPNLTKFVSPLRWLADRLTPFGSDSGGMLVEVVSHQHAATGPGLIKHRWSLEAQPGQGPFVPTIPARALLRNIEKIKPGARACIDELPLASYVQAMDDLDITTSTDEKPFNYLFADVLGDGWHAMPESIRNTHTVIDSKILRGYAKTTRGTSWVTQLIATIFRFPPSADRIPVQVSKTRTGKSEVWVRDFNGQQFKSTLSSVAPSRPNESAQRLMQEQFGLLKFVLKLKIDADALHFPVADGSCLGIPIPKVLLPESRAREFEKDGTMHFCVELLAPFNLGLIVRYEGWLK